MRGSEDWPSDLALLSAEFLIPMRGSEFGLPMPAPAQEIMFLIPMRGSELKNAASDGFASA